MRFSYHTEQWLPYSVEDVFAFFADPDNLPLLMPAWQMARIEEISKVPPPPRPDPLSRHPTTAAGPGTQLTLSFRPFPYSPVRIRWQAEITDFAWNNHFCDRQLSGPFAYWKHCHRVRPVDQHGVDVTLIVDHVEYELPLGSLGRLAHHLILCRQIEHTFAYRQTQLPKILAKIKPQSPQSQSK